MMQRVTHRNDKVGEIRQRETMNPSQSMVAVVGLILMIAMAYEPVVHNGFIWDDDAYIENNSTLRTVGGLGAIWSDIAATPQYYPLVHTTFWLEYRAWGLDPTGYHVVNVLLHATAALLVWRVLLRLGLGGAAAWFAAAVFALHPVHVESVAWITERKNVLSAVFYLASFLIYLRFSLNPNDDAPSAARRRWCYAAALLLFVCAILSKTVACSLPAAVLVVLWWRRGSINRSDVVALSPFFVIGLALAVLTVYLETYHVGTELALGELSWAQRCLIAGRAVWFYAGKLVWPVPLVFTYPKWWIDTSAWWQYLFPAYAGILLVGLWLLRRRVGRGPLTAVLLFGGTLLPALGFIDVFPMRYSYVADHFQYLASLGLIVLAAATLFRLSVRFGKTGLKVAVVTAATVLVVLGVMTWRQTHIYRDLETLWRDTLVKNPRAWMAHTNIADIVGPRDPVAGIGHYRMSLAIHPSFEAHYDLGLQLRPRGAVKEAIWHFRRAIEMLPGFADAHAKLADALEAAGEMDEALPHFEWVVNHDQTNAEARFRLGMAYARKHKHDTAREQLQQAVKIDPQYAEAHFGLGLVFEMMGRPKDATVHYHKAVRLNPAIADEAKRWGMDLPNRSVSPP